MRCLTNFYGFRFKLKPTIGIGIHPTKAWLSQRMNFKFTIWTLEERYAIQFCFKIGKICHEMKAGSTAMTQRPRAWVPSGSMLAPPDPRRLDRANPSINFWWSIFFFFFYRTGMIYIQWVPTRQTVKKEYYVEVLREFRKIFRQKRPALLKIGSVAFPPGQCISPQLHRCHRLFDQDGRQDSSSASL